MNVLSSAHKVLVDTMTGPDGTTWALGRFYSFPVLATGLWIIIDTHLHNRSVPGMGDLGIGLAGVGVATLTMISGTKNADTPGPGLVESLIPAARLTGLAK